MSQELLLSAALLPPTQFKRDWQKATWRAQRGTTDAPRCSMNVADLKTGTALTCRSGHFIGEFRPEFSAEAPEACIPWLIVTTISGGVGVVGEAEVLVYLGSKEDQTTLGCLNDSYYVDIQPVPSGVKIHEVLWRGCVYRVRLSTLRRLKRLSSVTSLRSRPS